MAYRDVEVAPIGMCVLLEVLLGVPCGFPPRIEVFCLEFPSPIGERRASDDKIIEYA